MRRLDMTQSCAGFRQHATDFASDAQNAVGNPRAVIYDGRKHYRDHKMWCVPKPNEQGKVASAGAAGARLLRWHGMMATSIKP